MKGWERKFKVGDYVRFKRKDKTVAYYNDIYKVVGKRDCLIEIRIGRNNSAWYHERFEHAYQLEFTWEE